MVIIYACLPPVYNKCSFKFSSSTIGLCDMFCSTEHFKRSKLQRVGVHKIIKLIFSLEESRASNWTKRIMRRYCKNNRPRLLHASAVRGFRASYKAAVYFILMKVLYWFRYYSFKKLIVVLKQKHLKCIHQCNRYISYLSFCS